MSMRKIPRQANAPKVERGKIPKLAAEAILKGFDAVQREAYRLEAQKLIRPLFRQFLHSLEVKIKRQQEVWGFNSRVSVAKEKRS